MQIYFIDNIDKKYFSFRELLNEGKFSVHKLLQKEPSYEVNLLTEFLLSTNQPLTQSGMINFSSVEKMMRAHLAALICHCGLGIMIVLYFDLW